jgi:hypothetical protein
MPQMAKDVFMRGFIAAGRFAVKPHVGHRRRHREVGKILLNMFAFRAPVSAKVNKES